MFYILNSRPAELTQYKSGVILIKDNWDDWFRYETQHYMCYVDSEGTPHEIGNVKIGQKNMVSGQRSAAVPEQFLQLPIDCFSLGQSDFYYERINALGDRLREDILGGLRDLAFFPDLYAQVRRLDVTITVPCVWQRDDLEFRQPRIGSCHYF